MEHHPTPNRLSLARRRPLWSLLTVVGLGGLVLSACASSGAKPLADPTTTTTTTKPAPVVATCPLTGLPVPGTGAVPARPALAVKVDNYPVARPQSGLDKADVVFEEPVEGGITRYAAVFQCQDAAQIGPIRSARNIDIGILGQLGDPLLAHVGGIAPVLDNISTSPIINLDLMAYGSLTSKVPGRYAPYDTYSSSAQLWSTHPTMTTAPQPLFTFSAQPPAGTPAASVTINFSSTSDVTWKYSPTAGTFQRFYNGTTPDVLADGVQNAAANVIVQYVHVSYGPWAENSQGGLEVQADLYPNATGQAEVFRGGVGIAATWQRSTLASPTQYLTTGGAPISLQPGATWVELVPDTISATITP
jgi:hypothetical protein